MANWLLHATIMALCLARMLCAGEQAGPLSPEESLAKIRVHSDLQVELVAAEPLVQDPVAIAWGADGKLWVVEMGDYPLGADGKPAGRVRFLEDTDSDGKFDKSTLFLDELGFPTGILPWRNGVLVTCAPNLFYAEDTDGDGKADKRENLYTGFGEGNQQHRVNGLRWGLDNWIHVAIGDGGAGQHSNVKSEKTGVAVNCRGRDIRIKPDEGLVEAVSGPSQFGRNSDDWGNWFGSNNADPVYHFVLEERYLARNPHFAAPPARLQLSDAPGAARVHAIAPPSIVRPGPPPQSAAFSSACSGAFYRDDVLGAQFMNCTYVCDPVNNLIHREVVMASGVTFKSTRAPEEKQSEYFASGDAWCRPTMILTGPDGGQWVCDMYRQVIEHPKWIDPGMLAKMDVRAGHDKGRIYRIAPKGRPLRPVTRLDQLDTRKLVEALDTANGWQRDMVQQLLLWRADKKSRSPLEKMALESKRPLARLHALCTLEGLKLLSAKTIKRALKDADVGVVRHAVRLAEPFLEDSEINALVCKQTDSSDALVRMQTAYTLGESSHPSAAAALVQSLLKNGADRFLTAAALSSLNTRNLGPVFSAVLASDPGNPPADLIASLFKIAAGFKDQGLLADVVERVGAPADGRYATWQLALTATMLATFHDKKIPIHEVPKAAALLEAALAHARTVAAATASPEADRLAAIRMLGRGLASNRSKDLAALGELLSAQNATPLQLAALQALADTADASVPGLILKSWRSQLPVCREKILDVLTSRAEWLPPLLQAMEGGVLSIRDLDPSRQRRLLEHPDAATRERAVKVLAGALDPDRQKVVDAYQPVLNLNGDAQRGTELFNKHCAVCHKLGAAGVAIGPDLAALVEKPTEVLLIAILDPNRALEKRYLNYTVKTKQGVIRTGIVVNETAASITLRNQTETHDILLTDIETRRTDDQSLMPAGLEQVLPPQSMADLIAYLRSHGRPRRVVKGNSPEVVKPDAAGALSLIGKTCELYGEKIDLNGNRDIGWILGATDAMAWNFEIAKAGSYEVSVEWSQIDEFDGNDFTLECGTQALGGKFPTTHGWEKFKTQSIGSLQLTAGTHRLRLAPTASMKGELADIRRVKLTPK